MSVPPETVHGCHPLTPCTVRASRSQPCLLLQTLSPLPQCPTAPATLISGKSLGMVVKRRRSGFESRATKPPYRRMARHRLVQSRIPGQTLSRPQLLQGRSGLGRSAPIQSERLETRNHFHPDGWAADPCVTLSTLPWPRVSTTNLVTPGSPDRELSFFVTDPINQRGPLPGQETAPETRENDLKSLEVGVDRVGMS